MVAIGAGVGRLAVVAGCDDGFAAAEHLFEMGYVGGNGLGLLLAGVENVGDDEAPFAIVVDDAE